jgi:hypothetical protein
MIANVVTISRNPEFVVKVNISFNNAFLAKQYSAKKSKKLSGKCKHPVHEKAIQIICGKRAKKITFIKHSLIKKNFPIVCPLPPFFPNIMIGGTKTV